MLITFHKPYGVLSQFTADGSPNRTLAEFRFPPRVYPIGRLDADSEGLLLLSDEAELNERLLHPRHAHGRIYWAQVERIPTPESLRQLEQGVVIEGRKTLPCRAWQLDPQPDEVGRVSPCAPGLEHEGGVRGATRPTLISPRNPPIRFRKNVPTTWIALELVEGKNRQVRKMTASIGHPTLRLVRMRIGNFEMGQLSSGEWKVLSKEERAAVLAEGKNSTARAS